MLKYVLDNKNVILNIKSCQKNYKWKFKQLNIYFWVDFENDLKIYLKTLFSFLDSQLNQISWSLYSSNNDKFSAHY